MGKLHNIVSTVLSTMGLLVGMLGGYELAGILGAIMFAPVGAFAGLAVSVLHIRLLMFLN